MPRMKEPEDLRKALKEINDDRNKSKELLTEIVLLLNENTGNQLEEARRFKDWNQRAIDYLNNN